MADIDKSLPNVRHEVKIPGAQAPTDVDITEEQPRQPVEVTPDEEGGATVNFEPGAVKQAQSNTHFDNLADILPEDVLDPVGIQLRQNYTDYKIEPIFNFFKNLPRMAGGGMVGIRKPHAIAPTGGPQSQGLASTPEYGIYNKEYKWQI